MSSTARFRPPRGGAALAVLAALAVSACARQSAAPETGAAAVPAAPAPAPPNAPPTAAAAPPGARPAGTSAASNAAAPAPPPSAAPPTAATPAAAPAEPPAAPELTAEQVQRRSPSAALVETFNAACADPRGRAVARAAKRLEFSPATPEALREAPGGAIGAIPPGADAWRGAEEVGGAVLVWDAATSTCELRAAGVNLLLVESAFSRLPKALEEEGASVMRLEAPTAPAGGVRTRQVLLVQPGLFGRAERARVVRLGHHLGARAASGDGGSDTVTLSARSVSAPR